MTKTTLTFEMGGEVDIIRLKEGITAFNRLLSALTAGTKINWIVEDLQPGSAAITVSGEADNPIKIEGIVDQFGAIGRALERREGITYSRRITDAANAIKKLAGSVEYVRFATVDADFTIHGNGMSLTQPPATSALGAVTGRVQTLSNRAGLRFNLYDTVRDKAVACYLAQGQEEIMREAWGRRARVSGRVSRETATGQPIAIRQIADVEVLEDGIPGSYRRARGAVPWEEGEMLPEDVIRRMRDA